MTQPYTGELTPPAPESSDYALWREVVLGQIATELAVLEAGPNIDQMPQVGMMDLGGRLLPARIGALGETHVSLAGEQDSQHIETAKSYVLQALESVPAGAAKLSVYNGRLGQHTGAFSDFAKGLGPKLYEQVAPGKLKEFLDSIEARNLDLANRKARPGDQAEPWHVSVIMADDLDEKQLQQLNRLVAAGPHYGSLVVVGPTLESHQALHQGWPFPVTYDAPLQPEDIQERCRTIALEAGKGEPTPELSSLMPERMWTKTAHHGIEVTPGVGLEGGPFTFRFDDQVVHGLLLGPTGKGKSVFLRSALASVTQEYPPEEVELSLVDYKKGVEFVSYTRPDGFLPHANLIATNVNQDPEYGLTVLAELKQELLRRGDEFRAAGVSNYAGMREAYPDRHLPRKLLVIDEVQALLKSYCGPQAVELLDYIASQGRAFGIHMLLTAQKVDDIPALATENLWENFGLRIAMPGGNSAAAKLPRYHALVNSEGGRPDGDEIVKVANSSEGRDAPYLQRAYEAYRRLHPDAEAPRVFDSTVVPALEEARSFRRLKQVDLNPKALLAEEMTIQERSAGMVFSRDPGRNLAVIGSRRNEANNVLHAAAVSLARQQAPTSAKFSMICLDTQSAEAINVTATELREQGHQVEVVRPANAPAFFSEVNAGLDPRSEKSHFVMVYGADASAPIMSRPQEIEHAVAAEGRTIRVSNDEEVMKGVHTIIGERFGDGMVKAPADGVVEVRGDQVIIRQQSKSGRAHLFDLLRNGPENGVHVLASYSSIGRLHETVDVLGVAPTDLIGAYVSLGVPPENLRGLTPGAPISMQTTGYDRANRGFFFDRDSGRQARMVIPYATVAGQAVSED